MRWCKVQGLRVDRDGIDVQFADERRHRVRVEEGTEELCLSGVVAGRDVLQGMEGLALRAWRRNRSTQLVGFRIDQEGRLVGEARVPTAGLSQEEFVIYVRQVAAECDRLEFLLTGKDVE
jgi:hypothetical protein